MVEGPQEQKGEGLECWQLCAAASVALLGPPLNGKFSRAFAAPSSFFLLPHFSSRCRKVRKYTLSRCKVFDDSSQNMSIDKCQPSLARSFDEQALSIIQMKPDQPIPDILVRAIVDAPSVSSTPSFISFTRTSTEVSIILPTTLADQLEREALIEFSRDWSALVVKGPMELSLSGIMHALCGPLKNAQVPVFASSTWDTDYILINAANKDKARRALEADGWTFWR